MWKNFKKIFSEIHGFFIDEIKLILSDSGAVLFFIAAMIVYSLLYTIGYEKETVHDLPVAMVDLDHSALSRQFSRMADATEQLRVSCKPGSLKEAEQLFYDGKINGVLLIPDHFEKDILSGKRTNVTVYCDAGYFMLYKQVYGGAAYSVGTFGAAVEVKKLLGQGKTMNQAIDMQYPLKVDVYNLYNPSGGYGSFVMPGMIIIIMQQTLLIGIGLLGGTIREKKMFLKKYGTVRHRWGNVKLVLSKSFAYLIVYLFIGLFPMVILHRWFAFPDKGHLLPILALLIPYLLAVSFLGMGVSMFFRQRVHSILFMVFLSPMVVFLSGISWPATAIPKGLYWLAHVFPSGFMVPAYIRLRLYGAGLDSVRFEWAAIVIQMIIYFIFACYAYKVAIKRMGRKIGSKPSLIN
jgi:ABC-2 type transport system permease protein